MNSKVQIQPEFTKFIETQKKKQLLKPEKNFELAQKIRSSRSSQQINKLLDKMQDQKELVTHIKKMLSSVKQTNENEQNREKINQIECSNSSCIYNLKKRELSEQSKTKKTQLTSTRNLTDYQTVSNFRVKN